MPAGTGYELVPIVEVPTAVARPAVATRHRVLSLCFSSRNLLPELELNSLYCNLEQLKTGRVARVFQILQIYRNDAPRSNLRKNVIRGRDHNFISFRILVQRSSTWILHGFP